MINVSEIEADISEIEPAIGGRAAQSPVCG
jgi:hypothetical protein